MAYIFIPTPNAINCLPNADKKPPTDFNIPPQNSSPPIEPAIKEPKSSNVFPRIV